MFNNAFTTIKLLKNVLFIFLFTSWVLVIIELFFYILNTNKTLMMASIDNFIFSEQQNQVLGLEHLKSEGVVPLPHINSGELHSSTYTLLFGDEMIYQYSDTRDQHNRRLTYESTDNLTTKDNHLILLGGSYTESTGLADSETLASYISYQTRNTEVYNYGVKGMGTSTVLRNLQENIDLEKQISQNEGVMIYVLIGDHIRRTIGDMNWTNSLPEAPYYYVDKNGDAIYAGSFIEGRPITTYLYLLLGKSQILKYYDVNLPIPTKEHDKLVVDLTEEMQKIYLKAKPDGKFYIAFHPCSITDKNYFDLDYLQNLLQINGINVLRTKELETEVENNPPEYTFIDGHAKASCQELFAEYLVNRVSEVY